MTRRSVFVCCGALIALICATALLADGPQTGTIDGRVLDAQGAALPGVTVTITGPQNTRTVITGADGVYRFALLLAGRYTVNAELEGLGTAELGTDLDPGQRRGIDLTLVSTTEEEITVTGEAPLMSRYETAAAATIPGVVTENVAFGTRIYNAALRQLPAVVNRNDSDLVPSVNGGISTEVGVYVEGVDTSMHRRGGEMRLQIPGTALTETKLESTGFGAEYGRATSGIINSTVKTGTNQFHGDFLYIGQNPKWRAPDVLDLERPDDQINSFETGLGGPIARNKAWFFLSYGSISENRIDTLRDGTIFDLSREATPLIAKVNFQPRDNQQIALTAIDAPSGRLGLSGNPGDRFAIMNFSLNGRVQTLNWSLGLGSSNFPRSQGRQSGGVRRPSRGGAASDRRKRFARRPAGEQLPLPRSHQRSAAQRPIRALGGGLQRLSARSGEPVTDQFPGTPRVEVRDRRAGDRVQQPDVDHHRVPGPRLRQQPARRLRRTGQQAGVRTVERDHGDQRLPRRLRAGSLRNRRPLGLDPGCPRRPADDRQRHRRARQRVHRVGAPGQRASTT